MNRRPGPSRHERHGRRAQGLSLLIFTGVLGFGAWALTTKEHRAPFTGPARVERRPDEPASMTEAERRAYIQQHITLENLDLGPDLKSQDDGPVPGLLRFNGTVRNRGTRILAKADLSVYPHDVRGNVMASYVEEILDGRGLHPGETRDFSFRIPARPVFTGAFSHRLR